MHMIKNLKYVVIISTNIATISLFKKWLESHNVAHTVAPQTKWPIPNMSKKSRHPFGSVPMILKLCLVKMFPVSFSCSWLIHRNIFQQHRLSRSPELCRHWFKWDCRTCSTQCTEIPFQLFLVGGGEQNTFGSHAQRGAPLLEVFV